MLTKLRIRNFKRFDDVNIELGKSVVFVGPNDSGKTTALQALALWNIGLLWWSGKLSEHSEEVVVNRKDLLPIPVPSAKLLWRDLLIKSQDSSSASPYRDMDIEIEVSGIAEGAAWAYGMGFHYSNDESLSCYPLKGAGTSIPEAVLKKRVAFLPPMSVLAATEHIKQQGEINVLVSQGQTAQVLRNLCFQIYSGNDSPAWKEICSLLHAMFGVELLEPELVASRSELVLRYKDLKGSTLDISSAGRGLQQTLLLLAHIFANPNTVLLIDEPDAHLETLRQREIYQRVNKIAEDHGSQIICATHSEVVLNEAAGRDTVVSFVGKPHRIDRGSQVLKALQDIGFDQFYQAEQRGWILYLEGSTDLAILQQFAQLLNHKAARYLERPFVKYVGNQPKQAQAHFYGLRDAYPQLIGISVYDRIERELDKGHLREMMWRKNEFENYFCMPEVLSAYARNLDAVGGNPDQRAQVMNERIGAIEEALEALNKAGPWADSTKATDDFLDPLFKNFFKELGLPCLLSKGNYHELVQYLPREKVDPEVIEKLDAILEVAKQAEQSR